MSELRNWIPVAVPDGPDAGLTHEARAVLSHIDGATPVHELAERTGLEVSDLMVVLGDLVTCGAVPGAGAPPEIVQLSHAQRSGSVAPVKHPSSSPYDDPLASLPTSELDSSTQASRNDFSAGESSADDLEDLPELEIVGDAEADDLASLPVLDVFLAASEEGASPSRPPAPAEASPEDASSLEGADDAEALSDPEPEPHPEPEAERDRAQALGSYRQLFETSLHSLPVEARVEWARTASGDLLCALCLDPMPGVVQAVLENPHANLEHARSIAEHHRHPVGLDALGRRSEYARDGTVRRLLLRNQQASERLLGKVLMALPLPRAFQATLGHELTDRAKRAGRIVLRQKFEQASSEEKVGLIVQTEGRCLGALIGITFDQKTTALLCRRTYQSSMIIQSLARFSAAPPLLLAHLLKQQIVVRNAHLKKLLQQHPNCPKVLKR